jgi:hypothetical protein
MGSYVPDESLFVFDAIPPRQYVGAKAYRKDLEDFFASFPGPVETFEIADLNVVTNGNLGFSHSIQLSVSVDSALGLVGSNPNGQADRAYKQAIKRVFGEKYHDEHMAVYWARDDDTIHVIGSLTRYVHKIANENEDTLEFVSTVGDRINCRVD